MENNYSQISSSSPFYLASDVAYAKWRAQKLEQARNYQQADIIKIDDLANLSNKELLAVKQSCSQTNMAIYQTAPSDNQDKVEVDLRKFAKSFSLKMAEDHRSAGKNGVVALTISNKPAQKNYVPYSNKGMNWHTDGYYNAPDEQIQSMVLHCFRQASDGGVNQFLDNEIAYIRVRDHNPEFIKALMHPQVLSIPENIDENGKLRAKSVGPVFSTNATGEILYMRYSARKKYIEWKDDEITKQAVTYLQSILENEDEFIHEIKLKAGQGVICNNSLHNRTGFDSNYEGEAAASPSGVSEEEVITAARIKTTRITAGVPGKGLQAPTAARIMYRVRFHNRISGE